MPQKGLFERKDGVTKHFRLHKKLYAALLKDCKANNKTATEAINVALAERYMPSLLPLMEEWKAQPRYKFPPRSRK